MNFDFIEKISQEYTDGEMGLERLITTAERDFCEKYIEPLRNTDPERGFALESDLNGMIWNIQKNAFSDGFSAGVCMILQCVKR